MSVLSTKDSRIQIVRKIADETVNNSDVLQDDDELKISVGANSVYAVNIFLYYNSGATADLKIDFTGPAGAIFCWNAAIKDNGGSNSNIIVGWIGSAVALKGETGQAIIHLSGLYIGAAAAGTLQLRWAQNTADVSNTKVLANSCIITHRLVA